MKILSEACAPSRQEVSGRANSGGCRLDLYIMVSFSDLCEIWCRLVSEFMAFRFSLGDRLGLARMIHCEVGLLVGGGWD